MLKVERSNQNENAGLDHNCGHNVVRTVPAVSGFSSKIRGDAGSRNKNQRKKDAKVGVTSLDVIPL